MKSLAGALSLLFLLTFIHSCSGNTDRKTVVVFQDGKTEVQYTDSNSQKTNQTPRAFNSPSFVGGMINNKEFLAIISSARLEGSSSGCYSDGVVRTRYGNPTQWTAAKMFTTVQRTGDSQFSWGDTTAVMKGNKIYVLITSIEDTFSRTVRDPVMIVGTVKNLTESNSEDVYIQWENANNFKEKLPASVHDAEGSKFMGGEGNGIATKNGTIIFPIVINNEDQKLASTLYSIDDGTTWLIGGRTKKIAIDGNLVEWSKNKLLFTATSQEGYWQVFESNDFGITWKQSPIFFGVWGNGQNDRDRETPGSVTTVPVDNEDVLLFAYPQNKKHGNFFDTLQLWVSDGQRIMCIGTISDESKEDNTGHSALAYVGETLYVTHQINPPGDFNEAPRHNNENWKNVIGLTPLSEFFQIVKKTVREWRTLDEGYKSKGIPTDALVGFLGNTTTDDKVWRDMYNCVNATVSGGKRVDGGFQFNGEAGSGAKWPVKDQGQNQLFRFTEYQFTLAATIIIHNKSGSGAVSLFGAIGGNNGKDVLIGLGYTKGMKWYIMHKSGKQIDTAVSVELDKEYYVAITFANKKGSVYVGDMAISKEKITLNENDVISHFFLGGTGESTAATNDNLCTVKNVMLFSKALDKREITQLTKVQNNNEIKEQTKQKNERNATENLSANSKVTPSKATERQALMPDTKPTIAEGIGKLVSATKFTNKTENIKSMPTKEPKEALAVTHKKSTNKRELKKKVINALNGNGDAVFEKDAKGDNGSAVSLPAVVFMCFFCSLISLISF